MSKKSSFPLFLLTLAPLVSFAAGSGFEGAPLWVQLFLFLVVYIPFPATFIFLGYLVTKVSIEKRKNIIKIYAPGAFSFAAYLTLLAFAMFRSPGDAEMRWVGITTLLLLFLTFVHSIYFSYKINQLTDRKYFKKIKYLWWAVAASIIVPMILPSIMYLVMSMTAIIPKPPHASVESKVATYIQTQCPDITKCRVVLSDFTDFNWDMFYYVSSEALYKPPFNLPKGYQEGHPVFVFEEHSIASVFEELPFEAKNPAKYSVIVASPLDQFVLKKDAVFSVAKESGANVYYSLHLASSSPK